MEDTYKTIAAMATDQYKEKGSRFIGFLFPIDSEEKVKNHLAALKKEHYSATHICYAYTLGHLGTEQTRLNDDGEPSGSAARPIFGQLQSAGVKDVLAAVVRYFGGTKLGIPGLINAYKTTTQLAMAQAEIIEKNILELASVQMDYSHLNNAMQLLKKEDASITSMDYVGNDARITFEIRQSRYARLESQMQLMPFLTLTHRETK